MDNRNDYFVKTVVQHTIRGFILMGVIIALSLAAGIFYYLTTPESERGDGLRELSEVVESVEGDASGYSDADSRG